MISWDDLRFLLAVHRHHTMTAAARALGTNVATVSRRIDRLSGDLGMPPFLKRSDRWQLNPALGDLIAGIDEFDAHLERTLNNARHGTEGYTAAISIGCPPMITRHMLLPSLSPDRSPPSQVALTFSGRSLAEGLGTDDIVLRVGEPEGGRIIRRRAGVLVSRLYRRKGAARSGCAGQDWVGLAAQHDDVRPMRMAATRFGRPPVIRVEQFEDVATAIRSTDLAGPLPEVLGAGDPALEPIPGTPSVESDLWLFYHASRRGDRPLHDVADWIVRSVRRISCEAASAAADDPGPIAVGG